MTEEIILPDQATTRAGLPGRYLAIEGGTALPKDWIRVEAIPGSRDYRAEMHRGEKTQVFLLRLLPLNETIWLAQLTPESEAAGVLLFLRFVGERVHLQAPVASDDELCALAESQGVSGQGIMNSCFMRGGTLVGDPVDILALMRALAERRLWMSTDYYEKR